jgi:hypothetical protein
VPIDTDLLNSLRILLMSEQEMYFFDEMPSEEKKGNIFVSSRNESLMLDTLKRLLKHKLSRFPTSIQQDEEILKEKSSSMDRISYNNVFYRMGQKRILVDSLRYIEQLIIEFNRARKPLSEFSSSFEELRPGVAEEALLMRFHEWARKEWAARWRYVRLESGQYGIASDVDLDVGQSLLSIPSNYVFSVFNFEQSALGKKMSQCGLEIDEENALLLFLMTEKANPASIWKEFFRALLPVDTPLQFTDEELKEIEGTFLEGEVLELLEQYQQEWKALKKQMKKVHLWDEKKFGWKNYLWARVHLECRMSQVERKSQETLVLLPLPVVPRYHSQTPLLRAFSDSAEALQFVTLHPLSSKIPAHDTDGAFENFHLFLYLGTVLENNPLDLLPLDLPFLEDLPATKMQLMEEMGLSNPHYVRQGPFSQKLIAALRLWMMTDEEVDKVVANSEQIGRPLEKAREVEMMKAMIRVLNEKLSEYPTTIAEDDELLRAANQQHLSKRKRKSVLYRREEKKIVRAAITAGELFIQKLLQERE